jgi:hypothetical protein
MIGFSGAVSELSAHFTAGSSQPMHWKSVRPEMVTTGAVRFPHFGHRVTQIHEILPIFSPVTQNWNFCSNRAVSAETGGFSAHTANRFDPTSGTLLGASPSAEGERRRRRRGAPRSGFSVCRARTAARGAVDPRHIPKFGNAHAETGFDRECVSSNPLTPARHSRIRPGSPRNAKYRRKYRIFARAVLSPDSQFADLGAPIAKNLRPPPPIFPFCGDFSRRPSLIFTGWAGHSHSRPNLCRKWTGSLKLGCGAM